ncbi:MAG: phospholipase D-like domain-containing protein [Pirellulaceae bacterium]|nr:phospholipase D-like domain-containing protein [Pirellulaceae bacterium]
MHVFLPVSRFLVEYDVAEGTPHSALESLTLRAISNGVATIAELENEFCVHRRLIVEALATLTREGWLALRSGGKSTFLLTSSGRRAMEGAVRLQSREVDRKEESIWMERLTGGLISGRDVRFLTSSQIEERGLVGEFLSANVTKNELSEGEVEPYLRKGKREWVHWIRDIEIKSKGKHWLGLAVLDDGARIENIPDAWKYRLVEPVLDQLFQRNLIPALPSMDVEQVAGVIKTIPSDEDVADTAIKLNIAREDFLITDNAHATYLRRVFRDAKSSILISSAFLSSEAVTAFRSDLIAALQRGVNIDLLWGYSVNESNDKGTVKWLRSLKSGTADSGITGRLHLNENPTDSHSKFLCWDSEDGYESCLGSFNWLSSTSRSTTPGSNVSIRTSDTELVTRICRIGASLWSAAQDERKSIPVSRWKRIAASLLELKSKNASDLISTNAVIKVVQDRDHAGEMTRMLNRSDDRVFILSHQLGEIAATRLEALRREGAGPTVCVRYGKSVSKHASDRAQEVISRIGGSLEQFTELHSKLIIADQEICLSSYNFLSADPFQKSRDAQELGLSIVCEHADWLAAQIFCISSAVG